MEVSYEPRKWMFVAQDRFWSRRDVLDIVSLPAFSDSATAERVSMNFNAEEFHWYKVFVNFNAEEFHWYNKVSASLHAPGQMLREFRLSQWYSWKLFWDLEYLPTFRRIIVPSLSGFYILLAMHHVMILGKWPTWCTNSLLCVYFYL